MGAGGRWGSLDLNQTRGEEGVLGEELVVPAREREALEVHRGREEHVAVAPRGTRSVRAHGAHCLNELLRLER